MSTPRKLFPALAAITLLSVGLLAADANDDFWLAARKGDVKTVEALLAKGVDVNTKFRYGATALSYACDRGHVDVVKVLLAKGATARDDSLMSSVFSRKMDVTKVDSGGRALTALR